MSDRFPCRPAGLVAALLSLALGTGWFPAALAQKTADAPGLSTMEHTVAAVLWMQTAAELRALQHQAFNLARMVLDRDLETGPADSRAVVVDIDETVLDNSPYQAGLIVRGSGYPEGWSDWCAAAEAAAVPGAVEFLEYAASRGVQVYYISNRKTAELKGTQRNLAALGFPQVREDRLLLRSSESSKTARRDSVMREHRIVLLLGDNLNDFSAVFERLGVLDRLAAVEDHREAWGRRFIVLPNPMYGDWEGAVYGYDWGAAAEDGNRMRKTALRPWERDPR